MQDNKENKDNEERRDEFVNAAEKLFKENGIVDTTINSIVKEMNVAKGLFYYYFKSKDDVIDAISDKYNEVFNEMMEEKMNQPTYEERLNQFVENCIQSFRKLNDQLEGNDTAVDLTVLRTKSIAEAKTAAIESLTKLFEEGMESKQMNFVHPQYYADVLIGGILTLIQEGEASNQEIKDIIMDLIERSGKD
jgi:AcrR family transcriptional regulator